MCASRRDAIAITLAANPFLEAEMASRGARLERRPRRKRMNKEKNVGEFSDAVVLKKFGDVPEDLSEL
jgi:hypothetical protein